MSFIFHPPSFSIVLHFPCRSFSIFVFFVSIFLFRHFPSLIFCLSFSFSVIFHPCFFVHHFPFPSFSTPAFLSIIFHSCIFFSCFFSVPSLEFASLIKSSQRSCHFLPNADPYNKGVPYYKRSTLRE